MQVCLNCLSVYTGCDRSKSNPSSVGRLHGVWCFRIGVNVSIKSDCSSKSQLEVRCFSGTGRHAYQDRPAGPSHYHMVTGDMFHRSHVIASVLFPSVSHCERCILAHSRCWRVELPGEERYRTGAKRRT